MIDVIALIVTINRQQGYTSTIRPSYRVNLTYSDMFQRIDYSPAGGGSASSGSGAGSVGCSQSSTSMGCSSA